MGLSLCSELSRKSLMSSMLPRLEDQLAAEEEPEQIEAISGTELKEIIAKQEQHVQYLSTPQLGKPSNDENNELCPQRGRTSPSLVQQIKERQRCPKDEFTIKDECEANCYMDVLQDDSMMHIQNTYSDVLSMIDKGNDTCREASRQGHVLREVNHDLHEVEADIDDTSRRLKGMRSLADTFSNILFRSTKIREHSESEDEEPQNRIRRSVTEPMLLPSFSTKKSKQECIREGVHAIGDAMEILKEQQHTLKEELEHQEKYMNKVGNNMDHVEERILNQSDLINSIKNR